VVAREKWLLWIVEEHSVLFNSCLLPENRSSLKLLPGLGITLQMAHILHPWWTQWWSFSIDKLVSLRLVSVLATQGLAVDSSPRFVFADNIDSVRMLYVFSILVLHADTQVIRHAWLISLQVHIHIRLLLDRWHDSPSYSRLWESMTRQELATNTETLVLAYLLKGSNAIAQLVLIASHLEVPLFDWNAQLLALQIVYASSTASSCISSRYSARLSACIRYINTRSWKCLFTETKILWVKLILGLQYVFYPVWWILH